MKPQAFFAHPLCVRDGSTAKQTENPCWFSGWGEIEPHLAFERSLWSLWP